MQPLLFYFLCLLVGNSVAYCPESCTCDNTNLSANCSYSEESGRGDGVHPLDVIPIMLNPSIRYLSASRNRVRKLEGAIRVYQYLELLDLSHNELKTLGRAQFVDSSFLQELDLSNNFLTSLHKQSLEGLTALLTLDLNQNALSALQEDFFTETPSLVELRLKGNTLSDLSDSSFMGLSRLRVLHLEDNSLKELRTTWFLPLENLRFLYLDGNQITQLPQSSLPLSALRLLSLRGNLLTSDLSGGRGSPFRGLKAMDTLDLSSNHLYHVPNDHLREVIKLKHLDISNNPIETLDVESFRSLFLLSSLKANELKHLSRIHPFALLDNIKLEELYLNSNLGLEPLPFGLFQSNGRIRVLSIRNGSWSTLSPHALPSSPLEVLHLGGQPLFCNCSLTWLWDLYHRNSSLKVDLDTIWCDNLSGSPRLEDTSVDDLACTDFTRLLVAISLSVIVTVSLLLLMLGIVCAVRLRNRRKNMHPCLYMKDETMIYKFSHPPQSSSLDPSLGVDDEPFYEVPKYSSNTTGDDDPKSSTSSSKYSSSGYVGSELWEPEYFATVKGSSKAPPYGSPHNSGGSTGGSSLGGSVNARANTGSLSSPLYFATPNRGQLIHQGGRSVGSPIKNRVNLYV